MTALSLATMHAQCRSVGVRWRPTLADIPAMAGVIAILVGILVLMGWGLHGQAATAIFHGPPTMKANTAVCFALLGSAVLLLSRRPTSTRGRTVSFVLIGVAAAIAIATAFEIVAGRDLGIDQLLFKEPGGVLGSGGRMAPLTAVGITVIALAAILGARLPRLAVALCSVALVVSALNVLTFVFAAAPPPILAGYTQMALGTAFAMGVLAIGVIGLLGTASPFALLAGSSAAAILLRGVLAMSLLVPAFMIWISLEGQHLGFYDTSYGTAIRLLGMISVAVVAIFGSARWIRSIDTQREALQTERDQFFDMSQDLLSVIGADGRFIRVNHAWESILGYREDELIGRPAIDLIHPDDHDRTMVESTRFRVAGEPIDTFQSRLRHADGSYRWLEWVSQLAPDGSTAFAIARDVTDRKHREDRQSRQRRVLESRNEELAQRAVHDPLTGLHNRGHFDAAVTRMERRWSRSRADGQAAVSVVIFDLDHFGAVNNQHGHQAGDAVLRVFAALLAKRFRESDLVARYGGEEFVVVLEGARVTEAIAIAEQIRAEFEQATFKSGDATFSVTVSAGCSQLGPDRKVSPALATADVWLAQAKRSGRNQVVGL